MKRCKNKECNEILPKYIFGRPQEYCKECALKIKQHLDRLRMIASRKNHGYTPRFNALGSWYIDDKCSNCGNETNGNVTLDEFHGEAICKTCGLIVGEMCKGMQ